MLKATLLLLLVLAASGVHSRQMTQRNPDLDTISLYIKAVLENLRSSMPGGIPELSIPPLEPLNVPVIDVPRIKEGVADVKLLMRNLMLKGLSSFVVDNAKGDLSNLGVDLDLYFPVLQGQSFYDLDGKILIFPLFGKGNAYMQVNDLRLKTKASVIISGNKVQLGQLSVDSSFSQVQIYLEGIVGGGNLGDLVNNLLNALGKLVFDKTKSLWLPELNRIIKEAVNAELRKVNLQDIIGGVLPNGESLYLQPVDNSANRYVDLLMEQLRPHLRSVDPLAVPDQIARFSKKVWLVTVSGSARLTGGRVSGLTTIHRAGNCAITGAGIRVTVDCVIGVNNLNGGFNAWAEFMSIGIGANIRFSVPQVRVRFRVSSEVREGATPHLDQFSITHVSNVGVQVSGLGPLDWILSTVANVVVNAVKGEIIRAIEGPVQHELRKVLGSVQIPSLP